MRVVVDRDRCEGNAVCVRIAPEVFTLDDDEYAMVTADPVPVEQETPRRAGHRRVSRARPCRAKTRPLKITLRRGSTGVLTQSVLRVDTRPPYDVRIDRRRRHETRQGRDTPCVTRCARRPRSPICN